MSHVVVESKVVGPPAARAGDAPKNRRRWRPPRWLAITLVIAVIGTLAAGIGAYVATRPPPTTTAQLMELSKLPHRPPPNFTLTDQHGVTRSLASFKGRPVALYFMDPVCRDVCPLVAQEFVDADRNLGATAHRVALIGVDVNPNAIAPHFLRSFDAAHGLDKLPNWYYFTGSLAALKAVWRKYALSVQIAQTGNDVHTTVIDFIGAHGNERSMAVPLAELRPNGTGYLPPADITQWGHGIANQLRHLLGHSGSG